MQYGRVTIDGEQAFDCLLADETWNGFAVPSFGLDTARRVADYVNSFADGETADYWTEADADESPAFVCVAGDSIETVTADARGLCAIGARAYTWQEVS